MGIIKQQFIAGVVEKYPEELLEFRINIEANMIACIFKDPDIISESNFNATSFKTKDARFLFGIANSNSL